MTIMTFQVSFIFQAIVLLVVVSDLPPSVSAASLSNLVAASGDGVGKPGRQQAPARPPVEPYYTGESANVSRLIESLMRGYDKRLRPNYKGSPVEVGISMYVSSVSSISEVNMDFTLDFYFRQFWHDERLAFDESEDELCISNEMLDKIWWPDTFFANAKDAKFHVATTKNAFLRIKPSGNITQSLRLTVTAMCPMELMLFPMDIQVCPLEIESYAYSDKHIVYKWKDGPSKSVSLSEDMRMPQFEVRGHNLTDKLEILSTGNYSRLACQFYFVRRLGYYLIQIYVPSSLIVVLSWVSFWLDRNAVPARVALGITTVLTLTTLIANVNSSLPKISYLKSIDVYLVTCFFMVFAALLEYAAVSFLGNRKWKPKQNHSKYVSLQPSSSSSSSACKGGGDKRCKVRDGGDGDRINLTSHGSGTNETFGGKANPGLQDLEMTCHPRKLLSESDLRMTSAAPRQEAGSCGPFLPSQAGSPNPCQPQQARSPPAPDDPKPKPPQQAAVIPNQNIRRANAIDKYSRVVFPVAFFAFGVTYWAVYIKYMHEQIATHFSINN